MIRVLDDMLQRHSIDQLTTSAMRKAFAGIEADTLSDEAVRRAQGSAGVRDLYSAIVQQIAF